MAQQKDNVQPELPRSPALVAPRDEAVVNGGGEVTFEWEPVEGATAYRIEVAPDADFEELLVKQEVGDKTALTVTDGFPTDGRIYYWRVLAKNENGWSHGDHVESFVSSTAADAEHATDHPQRPDEDEDAGPAAALFGSAATEAAAEATGSEALLEQERKQGVTHEGIEAGQILGLAVAVVLSLSIIVFIIIFWVRNVSEAAREEVVGLSGYPELREAELEGTRLLNQYEVVDEEAGVYRIPVDRAVDLILNEQYRQGAPGQAAFSIRALEEGETTPFSDVVTDSTIVLDRTGNQEDQ